MFILPPDDAMDLIARARTYGELDELEAKQLLLESGRHSPNWLSRLICKLASSLRHLVSSRDGQRVAGRLECQNEKPALCCEGKLT